MLFANVLLIIRLCVICFSYLSWVGGRGGSREYIRVGGPVYHLNLG